MKPNKTIFSCLLLLQASSVVHAMTALQEPYEYVHCKKKKTGRGDSFLQDFQLRPSLRTRDGNDGGGFRKLMPRWRPGQDDEGDEDEECITLTLCDRGDEFNHWTDDCNGKFWLSC
jgi:hypothetical protein